MCTFKGLKFFPADEKWGPGIFFSISRKCKTTIDSLIINVWTLLLSVQTKNRIIGCIHLLNTCKDCDNTRKYCGHTHEYWVHTWKMWSPASALFVIIVPIPCKYCNCKWPHFSSIGSILMRFATILTSIVTILLLLSRWIHPWIPTMKRKKIWKIRLFSKEFFQDSNIWNFS